MSAQSWSDDPETDAQLVAAVHAHDPELARKVQRRMHLLRLERVIVQAAVIANRVNVTSEWAAIAAIANMSTMAQEGGD